MNRDTATAAESDSGEIVKKAEQEFKVDVLKKQRQTPARRLPHLIERGAPGV
jgi:hypothetical protein